MRTLEKITIQNFKSIRDQTLELGDLNVFIGGNGSGKSNLIEVFRFLHEIINQNLSGYVAKKGGADTLLFFGRKHSPQMRFCLLFHAEEQESNKYEIVLSGTDQDALSISNFSTKTWDEDFPADLDLIRVYHFHDTSETALVKGTCDVEDNRFLRPQAENLSAFLYYLQKKHPNHFANIEDAIRQVAPFFDRFLLAPSRLNPEKIRLEWKEKGTDVYFSASSLSDGTLRFICLATLLLQPELPTVILLDEPELGLHPAAIALLADMLISAATRTQVLVATQSVTLLNHFGPENVWTVERDEGQSKFRHLGREDLSIWLDNYGDYEGYSLGELWEKNVLGARI